MVIHNHIEKRIKFSKLLLYGIIFSICFSFIGETVRGTDIKDLARINDEFLWLPTSIIWVYAYSYFNILNLDNLINSGMYPAYDGSAFAELIPNIFRPDFGHPRLLELGNFNVSPYIAPIYRDLGFLGCIIFTIIILYVSNYFYKKSLTENSFLYIGSFSVLYFCSIMSFFKNFWFFLPIIFQLFFIFFGSALLISKKSLHI
jgi:oligosaccharide repeat unit polymerase